MQKRHPKPNEKYWTCGDEHWELNRDLKTLFPASRDQNVFEQWRQGKRGIGDLPYPGYRPENESAQPK